MKLTRDIFERESQRRFGTANPERMRVAFWEWMIRRSEESRLREWPDEPDPAEIGHIPYQLREHFGVDAPWPIWNFDRMGATRTPHPDGRMICIGGEHEDFYDPDFCIYNDVIVLDLDGSVEIHGYPKEVFPPTDFHTATLAGNRLIVIGRIGYNEERHPGMTPVMALDLDTYRFESLPSSGEPPGWIFKHEAELTGGTITIRGGEVQVEHAGDVEIRRNFDDFAYDIATGVWTKVTDRRWRQYWITDLGGKSFMPGPRFRGCCSADDEPWKQEPLEEWDDDRIIYVMTEALFPKHLEYETIYSEKSSPEERIYVAGIPVTIDLGIFSIEIVIEGEMDEPRAAALAEDIKASVEADTGRPCLLKAAGRI